MKTGTAWSDAIDSWVDDERARLGTLTDDEIRRYLNNELSEPDANRVRALMIYDPALTPLLRKTEKPRAPIAIIVALFITGAIAAFLLRGNEPTLLPSRHYFSSNFTRGSQQALESIAAGEEGYLFIVEAPEPANAMYDIELIRDNDEIVWEKKSVRADRQGTFAIPISGTRLKGGHYRIDIRDANGRLAQSYPFVLTP